MRRLLAVRRGSAHELRREVVEPLIAEVETLPKGEVVLVRVHILEESIQQPRVVYAEERLSLRGCWRLEEGVVLIIRIVYAERQTAVRRLRRTHSGALYGKHGCFFAGDSWEGVLIRQAGSKSNRHRAQSGFCLVLLLWADGNRSQQSRTKLS